MGPHNRHSKRQRYVRYRLRILKELEIKEPPQEIIDRLLDEKNTSDALVDMIFYDIIHKARM